ncbi:hypothetical protein [Microvirga brassicacearum]|uniref:Uncharacterized protein n=1 Tax=Microvirga brassicacearum TaxID=2580413 RepID=A0A5N3P9X0_9HYPH|nr:hypothetical protein [Microvirga brassicacearum]KAB0266540.1 hypothetical protein FEZ63_14375 [Microvirga brassicacearum]
MTHPSVELAARNNALWCDAVCRAHGRPGEFHDTLWFNRSGTPPFYPDAVTLAGASAVPEQWRALSALVELPRDGGWAVKDSFSSLDLRVLGFRPLFDAAWIGLKPAPEFAPLPADCRLADMRNEPELAAWECAWKGESERDGRIFKPSLLSEPGIIFVAIISEERLVGGGVLNKGAGVVGLSNLFAREIEIEIVWRSLVARAAEAFPGLPLVGYEQEPDLTAALRCGFTRIGSLRIWHRS